MHCSAGQCAAPGLVAEAECTAPGTLALGTAAGAMLLLLPASGQEEYYFAEVDCWQTTHPSGVEVYCFPCGQVCVLLPLWAGWRAVQHVANRACVRVRGTAWVRHGSRPLRRSQVEAHHPGGLREVVSPEGAVCMVGPGGQASAANVDDLSEEIRWLPPPELERMESGLGAAA